MAMSQKLDEAANSRQVSIATARNQLPALVKTAEAGRPVEITRRGKPVAVLVSSRDFARMSAGRESLWDAIQAFRAQHDLRQLDVEEALSGLRDSSPGRPESHDL